MNGAVQFKPRSVPGFPEWPSEKASELFARGSAEGMTSIDVSAAVTDAEGALAVLRERASRFKAVITDPTLDEETVSWVKAEIEALDIESARMEEAVTRLRKRAERLAADEADVPRWEKYTAAKAARDFAEKALEAYPDLAEKIVALLQQAVAADDLVARANVDLPRTAQKLTYSHPFARGMGSIIGQVRLPPCTAQDKQHWPIGMQNLW